MVHTDTNIPIAVKANSTESLGYRSLVFERPANFTFESGDWIDIQPKDQILSGGNTYSLSSSPTEPDLMITFKDGFSPLKQVLASAKPGDSFNILQYGNDYKFTLNPNRSSTLVAGGVGVAPFRSMIKEMLDTQSKNQVHLIYMNKTPDFLFKTELDSWTRGLAGLRITYVVTEGLKKKEKTKILLEAIKDTDQSFYIAGPEGMVESTEHLLLDNKVALRDIKIDSFGGY